MKVETTELPGVLVIEPDVFRDERGFFLETYNEERYRKAGIDVAFVQDNQSYSQKNVLRGLHLQVENPQGKLVRVTKGEVFDVAVDVDPVSKSFKRWFGVVLSGDNHRQLWIPPGYAHGFLTLTDTADFLYKCTEYYSKENERSILWNDADLAIDWPIAQPIVSQKDAAAPTLAEYLNQNV